VATIKKNDRLHQWIALTQVLGYGLAGVWAFCAIPSMGGWSFGNGRLVVSALLFTFAAGWLEAFRRHRRAAKKARTWPD
jgi:hypothetical protein